MPQNRETTYEHQFELPNGTWTVRVFDEWWDDAERETADIRVALIPPEGSQNGGYETSAGPRNEKAYNEYRRQRFAPSSATPRLEPYEPQDTDERLDALKCSECGEITLDWGDEPVYECSRCGQTQVEENRCPDCNIFMAKVGTGHCPDCETGEEPEQVSVVRDPRLDGTGDLIEVSE